MACIMDIEDKISILEEKREDIRKLIDEGFSNNLNQLAALNRAIGSLKDRLLEMKPEYYVYDEFAPGYYGPYHSFSEAQKHVFGGMTVFKMYIDENGEVSKEYYH